VDCLNVIMDVFSLKNYSPSLKTQKNQSLSLRNSSLKSPISYIKAKFDRPGKLESDKSSQILKNENGGKMAEM